MTTYTKKIVQGSAYVFAGTITASLLGYIIRVVLAKNLTPAEYGLFYAVFTFVSFFMFFRALGLNQALIKHIAEFRITKKFNNIKTSIASVLTWQSISSLIIIIFLFIFSDFLGKNYFKDPLASLILKIFMIYIIFNMLSLIFNSIFRGFQKIKIFSISELLRNLIMLILIFIFLKFGLKILAPVFAFVLSWIIIVLILLPFLLKTFNFLKYKIKDFNKATKTLFKFGFPVMLTAIGGSFISRIDTLMLTYFTSLEQVGIYNVVLPSAIIFLLLSKSITDVVFPIISELWAKKDNEKLSDWLRLLYKYLFVFVAPVLLAVFIFSELFIRIFFGQAYTPGARALQILLIGVLFYILANLNNNTMSGIGKPAMVTKIIIFAAVINAIANLILIPLFGIEGAAFATTLSYIIVLILSTRQTTKFIKTKIPFLAWGKTLIASLVFVSVIYMIKGAISMNVWAELFISLLVGGIVYLALIYILKIIDIQEIKKYLKLVIK